MSRDIGPLLDGVGSWARRHPEVRGVALVGSYARDDADDQSDVDLIILTVDPHAQLGNRAWLSEFGQPVALGVELWGPVTSLRTRYADGLEVEFGVAPTRWAATDPVDPGTLEVVTDGFQIVYDPDGLLEHLAAMTAAG